MAVNTARPCWYCGVTPTVGEELMSVQAQNRPVCETHKQECWKAGKKVLF